MKKIFALIAAVVLAALAVTGCTSVAPLCATSNAVGSKVGTTTSTWILGIPIPLSNDNGIQTAAKNGKISKISTVDVKVYYVGGFYVKLTTVVTGE